MTTADRSPSRELNAADLAREKSIWQIYRLSYKFPGNRFNRIATLAAAIFLAGFAYSARKQPPDIAATLRALLGFGVAVVPTVLGFLVAGFTIFVTITKADILVHMATREYDNSGESYLKYNLSAFMLAFTHYLGYLAVCLIMITVGQPNGPVLVALRAISLPAIDPIVRPYTVILAATLIVFGTWTAYIVLLLKSFIYNVYQVLTTTVRWEVQERSKSQHGKPTGKRVDGPGN